MTLSCLILASALAPLPVAGGMAGGQVREDWRSDLPSAARRAVDRVDASRILLLASLPQSQDPGSAPPPGPAAAPVSAPDEAQEQQRKAAEKEAQKDIELGGKYADEVAKEMKFSENQEMVKRVETIGKEIADIANSYHAEASWGDKRVFKFPYTFKVVKDDDVNAFSIPGGHIYVYEGLINFAETDDELAGVIAHEISHAAFRHVAEMQRKASKLDLLQIPLIIAAIMSRSSEGIGALTAATMTSQAFKSGWSLSAETAADWGAIQYMHRSKYNPVGVLTLMERLAYRDQATAGINWGIYATHPPSRERAVTMQGRLKQLGIPILRSEVTTSLRAVSKIGDDQGIDFYFGKTKLHTFRGDGAIERSEQAVKRFNRFSDSTPGLDEVSRDGYRILGAGRSLFEVSQSDLLPGQDLDAAFTESLNRVRAVIFDLNYRLWNHNGFGAGG